MPSRQLLPLAISLLVAGRLAAQQRLAAAADTGHTDQRIFADIITGNQFQDVVLGRHVIYRVELRPSGDAVFPSVSVTILPFPANGLPPLSHVPLSDPNIVNGGVGFDINPSETGMYRMTVSSTGPVDIRIIRDARETERVARMDAGIQGPSTLAGVSLRAVYLGSFYQAPTSFGQPDGSSSSVGPELCVDLALHLPVLNDHVRGCGLIVDWFDRSGTAPTLAIGTSPHYILSGAHGWTRTFASLTLAFAVPTGPSSGAEYTMGGLGLGADHQFSGRLRLEAEAGFMLVHPMHGTADKVPPRLTAGLQYLL